MLIPPRRPRINDPSAALVSFPLNVYAQDEMRHTSK